MLKDSIKDIVAQLQNGQLSKEEALERIELLKKQASSPVAKQITQSELSIYEPSLKSLEQLEQAQANAETVTIFIATDKKIHQAIERHFTGQCQILSPNEEGISIAQTVLVQLFQVLKSWLLQKQSSASMIRVVSFQDSETVDLSISIAALLKTVQQENPQLHCRSLHLPAAMAFKPQLEEVITAHSTPYTHSIIQESGIAACRSWQPVENAQSSIPWKSNKVYLISGGVGKLGLQIAEEIANTTQGCTLVLFGRSRLSPATEKAIQALREKALVVDYWQVNVSDAGEVHYFIHAVTSLYGTPNGMIHLAGIYQDNYITRKSEAEFKAVLAPKITGAVLLDEATRDMKLDFFILFSSIAGVVGNVGQSDYAAANGFLNAFATYRNTLVAKGKRFGHTLAINWPFWTGGGMQMNPAYQEELREKFGLKITPTEGMAAFYKCWGSRLTEAMVLKGDQTKLSAWINEEKPLLAPIVSKAIQPSRHIQSKLVTALTSLIAKNIKTHPTNIERFVSFERYGIDSFMITRINTALAAIFPRLSKTVFYEYPNVDELSTFLLAQFPQESAKWVGEVSV
ncbi:MAG: SDR family NAD(P)-dependent oxidoreductase, partial [Flammeovirgaceae bacterium]